MLNGFDDVVTVKTDNTSEQGTVMCLVGGCKCRSHDDDNNNNNNNNNNNDNCNNKNSLIDMALTLSMNILRPFTTFMNYPIIGKITVFVSKLLHLKKRNMIETSSTKNKTLIFNLASFTRRLRSRNMYVP